MSPRSHAAARQGWRASSHVGLLLLVVLRGTLHESGEDRFLESWYDRGEPLVLPREREGGRLARDFVHFGRIQAADLLFVYIQKHHPSDVRQCAVEV